MDFRETIAKNKRMTKVVVVTYIFIMLLVGILADTALRADPSIGLIANMELFITLKRMPYVTFIIMSLTIGGIFIIKNFGHKIMMTGINAREIKEFGAGAIDDDSKFDEARLHNIIRELSVAATLGYTPKLYIMETDELNAFAAGWCEKNALVGITRGLLNNLNREEVKAVMAHEIGHIIHGDSRLTLYVGILANVILTVTSLFSSFFFLFFGRANNDAAKTATLILIVMNMILPVITQILYLFLSRKREYMADAAAVDLLGYSQPMISALEKIEGGHKSMPKKNERENNLDIGDSYRSAAYIYKSGDSIFSTHPSISNRIKELEKN